MIRLYDEDCETIIAFIKMHEREEIPDDVWELCMRMYDAVYGVEDGYAEGYDAHTLPAAHVKPLMRGKWIKDSLVSTSGGTYGVFRCSNCEASYPDIGYGYNFCPNCGADMREANDE